MRNNRKEVAHIAPHVQSILHTSWNKVYQPAGWQCVSAGSSSRVLVSRWAHNGSLQAAGQFCEL
jgi:hypothetical protein